MTINWIPLIRDRNKPAYLAIASCMAEDIAGGRLRPGDPLPTQRDLADHLGVALGTVTRAYAEARKRGLVHAQGRRGTFIGPGPEKGARLDALIRPGPQMIDLSSVQPLCRLDPDLGRVLADLAARADLAGLSRYPAAGASDRHRHAGVQWMKLLGKKMGIEDVILTSGGQNGIYLALAALARPGDHVLTEEPCYPGIKSVARALNLTLVGVETDGEGVLPDALAAACRRTRSRILFCIPEIQNPTTATMGLERRQAVTKVARSHDLFVIEDLIHRPLVSHPQPLLSDMLPKERSIVLASTSKTVASGLRVGFMAAPPSLHPKIFAQKQAIDFVDAPLNFEIFASWVADGTAGRTIRNKRREARARQEILKKELAGLDVRTSESAYFAWMTLPGTIDRARFAARAGEMGVSVLTSDVFALDPGKAAQAVRISVATPNDRDILARGLRILAGILNRSAGEAPCLWV